jgi:predicted nucleic acid-binding Zn ribbon protein
MPIYEYRRPDGTTFEMQQSFSEEALTVDPDTGVPVERVLHPPAVHFKGKGFYNTDYGTRKRQRETAAAAEGSSSSDSSGSSKDSSSKDSSSSDGASSSDAGSASSSSGADGKGAKAGGSKDSGAKSKEAKAASSKKG